MSQSEAFEAEVLLYPPCPLCRAAASEPCRVLPKIVSDGFSLVRYGPIRSPHAARRALIDSRGGSPNA